MDNQDKIQAAHQNMLYMILQMFFKREPFQEDYSNTKIVFSETTDRLKQFYNVSIKIDKEYQLLGTVNIEGRDLSKPVSSVNKFTLVFVPVAEGMESITVKFEI